MPKLHQQIPNGAGTDTAVGSGSTRAKIADKDYDPDLSGAFWFEFSNGKRLDGNINDYPEEIQKRLTLHGVMQKIGDSYASVKGDVGKGFDNATAMHEALRGGDWGPEREGGGPRLSELIAAIAKLQGISEDEAKAALLQADAKQLSTLRSHPQIKLEIQEARTAKAKAEVAAAGGQTASVASILSRVTPQSQPAQSQPAA